MGSVIRIITLHWSGVNGEEYLDLSLGVYICTHLLGVNLMAFESRAGISTGFVGFWLFPRGFAHPESAQSSG